MIINWEQALEGTDLIAEIEEYEDGAFDNWSGKVWVVHITIEVMGTKTFLFMPTSNNENTDTIMAVACEKRGDRWCTVGRNVSMSKLLETRERGVPYEEVLAQFREEIRVVYTNE